MEVTQDGDRFRVVVAGKLYLLKLNPMAGQNAIVVDVNGRPASLFLLQASPHLVQFRLGGEVLSYRRETSMQEVSAPSGPTPQGAKDIIVAPMPGKVITALVKDGEQVKAGDPLVILESMKMEVAVRSDRDAEVGQVLVREGMAVKRGQALVRLT